MATEMFFKADVPRKSAHIADSSGRDFGGSDATKRPRNLLKVIVILGMQHVLTHMEQLHKDAIFPLATKSTLRNSAQKQEFILN